MRTVVWKAASYAVSKGKICFNGVEDSMDVIKPEMGFVPQHDNVHTDLTVRENLQNSAQLRLPPTMTKEKRDKIVDDCLNVLKLNTVEHAVKKMLMFLPQLPKHFLFLSSWSATLRSVGSPVASSSGSTSASRSHLARISGHM